MSEPAPYRVLARKYRPTRFGDLIGQEALVRTLTNAIQTGRLAHAYLLTGVRGVGKTSTARIIARALNCTGNGATGPVVDPCGECENCLAIAGDRHVDVLEMDAASRTGVDDIRELIDGVRYLPVQGRFKVYIIDEVHMLSSNAFNALLKTLEEPPEHVKFIFATTESRKVPVTVLSRCQRFDLRRVETERLAAHFGGVAEREGVKVSEAALAMIARAADGSVRDGLSLLDQAISIAEEDGVGETAVREMLGLADRAQVVDLFEGLMGGKISAALDLLGAQYRAGADPVVVIQDLLAFTHWVTRLKVTPGLVDDPGVPEDERLRGKALAERLGMAELGRTWQMLLKALGEAQTAPAPLAAVEMAFVRLAYAADLPTPAEVIKTLNRGESAPAPAAAPSSGQTGGPAVSATASPPSHAVAPADGQPRAALAVDTVPEAELYEPETAEQPEPEPAEAPLDSFQAVVDLFAARGEQILYSILRANVHLVRFEPGRIEFRPDGHAPANLAGDMSAKLTAWTGRRWVAVVSQAPGDPTLDEQAELARQARRERAAGEPLVQEILKSFPGAQIVDVRAARLPATDNADEDGDEGP